MPRNNILFLFADQMHAFAMTCMGNPDIHTPNLDRLAAEGMLFRNCYSNAPVCTPFRVALFTGLYGSRTESLVNRALIPPGCETLADSLNGAGYRTSYVGKWHIGDSGNQWIPPELRGGFTEFIGYQCYNDFLNAVEFYDEDGACDDRTGRHRTDATTDISIDRLRKLAARENPFALFVSYQNPHYPEQPSPEYYERYRGKDVGWRPNTQDVEPFTLTHSPKSPRPMETDPLYAVYGGNMREYLRQYYAMVTQMDASIGRLLAELDALGIADETLVVFTSDHGDLQGSHGLKNKSLPWEESTRIPLVVRSPDGSNGVEVTGLTSGIDFFPTLAEYAGAQQPATLDGQSFAPTLCGEPQTLNAPVFSEMRRWCMIRDGAMKLVADRRADGIDATMLFDLDADPYEMENLVADSRHVETRQRLFSQLEAWDREVRSLP